jgi:predicted exporter
VAALRRGVILVVWLAIAGAAAAVALRFVPVVFDLTRYLPVSGPAAALMEQWQEGASSRLVLIGIDGEDSRALAAASLDLARRLRETGLFRRVENGALPADRAGLEDLFDARYLLSAQTDAAAFEAQGLRRALLERLRELRGPASIVHKRLLPSDPTGAFLALLQHWQGAGTGPERRMGVWFAGDGRALLLAESRHHGFDPEAQGLVVAAVRSAFEEVPDAHRLGLVLGGPGPLAVASQRSIRGETEMLGAVASLIIVAVLAVLFRSPLPVILSLMTLATAVVAATLAVGGIFGTIHGITLGFGITLLGVAVDYPIHVFSHGHGSGDVRDQVARIWPVLRLSAASTAIGYFALINASFPAVSQLGVFGGVGALAAVASSRWLVPAVLPRSWAGRPIAARRSAWAGLMRLRVPHARPWAAALALAMLGLLAWKPPLWEDDLATLSPVSPAAQSETETLQRQLGAPEVGHVIAVAASDAEAALQRTEALKPALRTLLAQGAIGGYESPADILPSERTQRARQAMLPETAALHEALAAAVRDLPFRQGLLQPFVDDVARARVRAPVTYEEMLATPLGARLGALLFRRETGWTALVPLKEVRAPDRIEAAAASPAGAGVRYVNLRAETQALFRQAREQTFAAMIVAAALLVVVLRIGLRGWRPIPPVLLPIVLGVTLDVLVLTWIGERLSLLHLVALMLVAGIGLDYSLFLNEDDRDPARALRSLHATLVCCATTLVMFGLIALSSVPILRAIGATVAIGVLANFAFAHMLAPRGATAARARA